MNQTDELLTLLLALGDAVHVGLRANDWRDHANVGRRVALRDFGTVGTQVPNAGGPAASVARQRLLPVLQQRGLLRVHRRQGAKEPYARLTADGDAHARQICALPGLAASHAWLVELCDLSARAVKTMACDGLDFKGAVDERNFLPSGEAPTGRALATIEEFALPALVRGWAECNSDLTGLVAYWPTAAGREVAAGPAPPDEDGAEAPGCRALYEGTFARRRASLATTDPNERREIGPLPLAAGGTTFRDSLGKPTTAVRGDQR